MKKADLRVCCSCEWIFRLSKQDSCPKCGWPSYGARYVYGNTAYRYERTQKPWFDRNMSKHAEGLHRTIAINLLEIQSKRKRSV